MWRYDFSPQKAVVYSIHIKAFMFEGFPNFDAYECTGETLSARNIMFDGQQVDLTAGQSLKDPEAMNTDIVRELAEQGGFCWSDGWIHISSSHEIFIVIKHKGTIHTIEVWAASKFMASFA